MAPRAPSGQLRSAKGSISTETELDLHFTAVEDIFSKIWLDQAPDKHRLQKLWHRDDNLATLELEALGRAVGIMNGVDAAWVKQTARAARANPDNCHGPIFELVAAAMFATAGMKVRPMPKKAPGYDLELPFDDGHVVRMSLKNHDMSTHEKRFHEGCERVRAVARHTIQKIARRAQILIASETSLHASEFNAIARAIAGIRAVSSYPQTIEVGRASVTYRLLDAAAGSQFHDDYYSDTVIVVCPQHENEQKKFVSKLKDAENSFAKTTRRSPSATHALLMRLHQTADIKALEKHADTMLAREDSSLDLVILYQPSVVRTSDGASVIANTVAKVGDMRARSPERSLKIRSLVGEYSSEPSQLVIPMSGLGSLPTGSYMYQRGSHFVRFTETESGVREGWMQSPASGIQTYAVLDGAGVGEQVIFSGKFAPTEDLLIL